MSKNKKEEKVLYKKFGFIEDIIPFVDYKIDKDSGRIVSSDGKVCDFLKIKGKDLSSMLQEYIDHDNSLWNSLYKKMVKDIKIIGMNFPEDTSIQLDYCLHKYNKQKNPILKIKLEEQINILREIAEFRMAREFLIFFVAEDKEDINKTIREIYSILAGGNIPICEILSNDKKMKIMFKLFNKNTTIVAREGEL